MAVISDRLASDEAAETAGNGEVPLRRPARVRPGAADGAGRDGLVLVDVVNVRLGLGVVVGVCRRLDAVRARRRLARSAALLRARVEEDTDPLRPGRSRRRGRRQALRHASLQSASEARLRLLGRHSQVEPNRTHRRQALQHLPLQSDVVGQKVA